MSRIYSAAVDSDRVDIPKHPLDAQNLSKPAYLFPITKFTVLA